MNGVEAFLPPGIRACHLRMFFAQLARGIDVGEEGMNHHLHGLALQFTRHLDKHGYVRFRNWRFFGEDGLAGEEVCVWVYEDTLKVEYQTTALALYSLRFSPDHEQIAEVTNPRRIQTPFRSPQLDLWPLSDTEWLLALRRPELAPRRNRGKIVALARQLPLLDVSATG